MSNVSMSKRRASMFDGGDQLVASRSSQSMAFLRLGNKRIDDVADGNVLLPLPIGGTLCCSLLLNSRRF